MGSESQKGGEEILRVFQSRKETRSFYDKISRFYDLLAERSEQPVRSAGLAKLGAMPGETVLEIGFGTGHCLALLAEATGPDGMIYGIDLSEGMLKVAQKTLRKNKARNRISTICGDATQLPFYPSTMDAVFMSFTLELFDTPDIPRVLSECRRVLRQDGRIVVVGMSKDSPARTMVHAFEWTHRHFPNFLDCRPIFVRRSLESAGFRIISTETKKMWVPVEIVLASLP
jgi:demethylmenaquinone methyltransferase/2-methoxy-6-polyprenyl-1,4-benzoquinol methylase